MNKGLIVGTLLSLVILGVLYTQEFTSVDAFEEWKQVYGATWN